MQFLTLLALASTALASAIKHNQGRFIYGRSTNSSDTTNSTANTNTTTTILYCDSRPYIAGTYVCYNGTTLCAVLNGNALVPCGQSCYDTAQFGCENGNLVQLDSTGNNSTAAARMAL